MLKVENLESWGLEHALRGMRNPMNSWGKSDSTGTQVGEADLKLMRSLFKAGTEHRKYLRQVFISLDITAPLYWFKEFDTYKVGTTANSCSTMHKIHSKEFELSDFSIEHLSDSSLNVLGLTIDALNHYRGKYLESKSKEDWWQLIQLLPSSYNQRRTVTMNYENVFNIIHQRDGHKLDEWHTLINELKKLPYVIELLDC